MNASRLLTASLRRLSCRFSSSSADIASTPLDHPLPNFPPPIYASSEQANAKSKTRVTRLANGLTVASENVFGHFATVGVIIRSGSRYEVAFPSGCCHFLEKLAFGATHDFPGGRDEMQQALEKVGGICDSQSTRDTTLYAASVDVRGVDTAVRLIFEATMRPTLTDDELDMARQAVLSELDDLDLKPEKEPLLTEMIHAAAYPDNTLGLPRFTPAENVAKITRQHLMTYKALHYTPDRMCVAAIGVDHDELLRVVERHFVDTPPIWESDKSLLLSDELKRLRPDASLAQYIGGEVRVEKDLSNVSLGPTPMPELAHFVLALECPSHCAERDFIATCVLNMLMGGGGSFSAGGPGKGMYTRLYLDVLNRYHWVHQASAACHIYADSGIFTIQSSSSPRDVRKLVDLILFQVRRMADGQLGDEELARAKQQLQSMLLMNLESRPVMFEDLARQVLAYDGRRKNAHELQLEIQRVEADDLVRVARQMMRSRPSIACLGALKSFPTYEYVEEQLAKPLDAMQASRKRGGLFNFR